MARKPTTPRAGKTRAPEADAIDPKHRWDRPIQAPRERRSLGARDHLE